MRNQNESRPLALGLTLISALGRLVPHAPNVTPLGGSCLFAGSKVSGALAYLVPLAVMASTDWLVGGYSRVSIAVYLCFLLNVFIGRRVGKNPTAVRIGAAAFLCSAQFFVITNFAVWLAGGLTHSPWHRPGLATLMTTYTLGLPFWGRTLAGDLLFTAVLFSAYEFLVPRLVPAYSKARA